MIVYERGTFAPGTGIAATMLTNGLDTILTQNVRDFSGLDGVHPLTLADVIVILSTLEADDSI